MNERTQGPLDSCYPRWIPEPHTSVFRSAHGAHPLPWTVPAARAALGQPNRRLTAGPAPQCAHVPRAWQSQERRSTCTGAGHAGRWGGRACAEGRRLRREGGKRQDGAAGSTPRLFPPCGRRADSQGTAAISDFHSVHSPSHLSLDFEAIPCLAGPELSD